MNYSPPYTPEQNGAAEIINRVLLNKVRALLINSNLPKSLWGEAILTATYLYNRTPSSSIRFKTPYELKYKELPNISNIRVFGSLVYNKEPNSLIKKLDSRATPYYLIGFVSSNIYKLYNPKSNKVITSRDCKIIEGYYYKPNNNSNIQEIFTKLENNSKVQDNSKIVEINSKDKLNTTTNRDKNIINRSRKSRRIVEDYSEDKLAINNTIETSNIYKDWKSLYNKSILYNILNTSSSNSNLEEPKSYKEVLLREDKDLYLQAIKIEVEDLLKSNT